MHYYIHPSCCLSFRPSVSLLDCSLEANTSSTLFAVTLMKNCAKRIPLHVCTSSYSAIHHLELQTVNHKLN